MASEGISRRGFVAGAAVAGGSAILVPNSFAIGASSASSKPTLKGTGFPDGIASGDPRTDSIVLWTRVGGATATSGKVLVEVAKNPGFTGVVKRTLITAEKSRQHVAKTKITGLSPYTQYYYRFKIKTSSGTKSSEAGKFRTALPADSNQTVKFAYFTCQDYTAGFFNAHALIANEDIDFVINLGDFIYETAYLDSSRGMARPATYPTQLSGPVTYAEYCGRYQGYRKDADLRKMAASHAMLSTWDDHEVMNDYAGAAGANGGNASKDVPNANPVWSYTGWSENRKINAYQAWFDNMPTFPQVSGGFQLYQKASFGKNLDLWVLDERQYRSAQPCGYKASEADMASCTDLNNPRDYLGQAQLNFLKGGLASSAAKWKVIANEVMAMAVKSASGSGKLESPDGWAAYPVERQNLMGAIKAGNVKNVVFATGDYHSFIAGKVREAGGDAVATEFAAGSVTALSDPEVLYKAIHSAAYGWPGPLNIPAGRRESDYIAANPDMLEFDQLRHGYVLASASATEFTASFKKLATTTSPSTALAATKTYKVAAGSTEIQSV